MFSTRLFNFALPLLFLIPLTIPSELAAQNRQAPALPSNSEGSAQYRFDVGGSIFAQITGASDGNFIREDTDGSLGGLVSFRQPYKPWLGYEVNYGLTSFPEYYSKGVVKVTDLVHEMTAGYLLESPPLSGLKPFLAIGTGMMVFQPTSTVGGPRSSQLLPLFYFSLGINRPISERLGVRLQFRGLHYKTPNFNDPLLDTKTLRTTMEPALGVYYRF